jgi:molybdate transport system regulatory protein
MKIDLKIYIIDSIKEPFMGRGPFLLLRNIEKTGSIRKAAMKMGMSYSKAHSMISRMECCTARKVLKKEIGGLSGGGSRLTGYGKRLAQEYERMEADIKKFSRKRFRKMAEKI